MSDNPRQLARVQPCGCVTCCCEDPSRCWGCGAKSCGKHPAGQIPFPVYMDNEIDRLRAELAAHQDAVRVLATMVVCCDHLHMKFRDLETPDARIVELAHKTFDEIEANPIAAAAIAAAGKKEEQG